MRLSFTLFLFFTVNFLSYAQNFGISGNITDAATGEPIIGAAVSAGEGKAIATDLDGNYKLKLIPGDYVVKVTYVGYPSTEKKITVADKWVTLNFNLETKVLRYCNCKKNTGCFFQHPNSKNSRATRNTRFAIVTQFHTGCICYTARWWRW
jgi:uncharacterized membrane protein